MINLKIEYFAALREAAGRDHEQLHTKHTNIRDVFEYLRAKHQFVHQISDLKVAVNERFVDWDHQLQDNDKLVFIPPVSGG